tara:strand:+ start:11848 stop:12630 length:783 start_codon:yes stop_codon:yes gene_type:complete
MHFGFGTYLDENNIYLISGDFFRRIEERSEVSFDSKVKNSNLTGVFSFGFSGDGNIYKFSFLSGKVIDPNDNYVFSYGDHETIKISGNLNDAHHSYYINEKPFQLSGTKNSFNVQRFFAEVDDVEANFDMYVFGNGSGGLDVSFDEEIDDGKIIDMTIHNSGSGISFDVFSGKFHPPYGKQITILNFPSGISTSKKFQVSGSGTFPSKFEPSMTLNTSFGDVFVSGIKVGREEGKQFVSLNGGFVNVGSFSLSNFAGGES